MVFDNVNDNRIVDRFWPLLGSNTAVIVITRDEIIAQGYAALEDEGTLRQDRSTSAP